MKDWKKLTLVTIVVFLFSFLFFSYRLLKVPNGLTIDEAAFGYNGVLLSKTLRDETGRFAPIFALSINGKDWRQPVMQYFIAGYFKLFGTSLFNLKITSVIIAAISTLLIFVLGKKLLGNQGAMISVLLFATTPIILIQSHLALDNIMTIPFTLIWLLTIYQYEKTRDFKYLIGSGISLGMGFYSYKGMRSFAPAWSVLTVLYIGLPIIKKRNLQTFKKNVKPVSYFLVSIIPFYAIIPLLEKKYAGAVLGQANVTHQSVYNFFLTYLSSFDPSFLFVRGDEILNHSTGRHGMFLLAALPFFIFGIVQALKKSQFWKLIVISFFAGPVLFGFPGSIHRASRLIAFTPLFILITTLGFIYLFENRKKFKWVLMALSVLFIINASDFLNYYWYSYADDTFPIFYHSGVEDGYKMLYEQSKAGSFTPIVDASILNAEKTDEGYINTFFRSIYFPTKPRIWEENETLSQNSILLTRNPNLTSYKIEKKSENGFYLYTNN